MSTERKSGLVALIGRPNAGKSTLLNRVLGSSVSIVTPKAQTTRERVLGILTAPEGQIVFVDTPGIHKAKAGGFNEFMVGEAGEALDGPNQVWYLVDPDSELEHEQAVIAILEKKADRKTPVSLILNKSDVRSKSAKTDALVAAIEKKLKDLGFVSILTWHISGRRGQGVDSLLA
ncbi:MAG: GTPase, partial [Oligoflexia bacterium]